MYIHQLMPGNILHVKGHWCGDNNGPTCLCRITDVVVNFIDLQREVVSVTDRGRGSTKIVPYDLAFTAFEGLEKMKIKVYRRNLPSWW